jgi:cysteine synthase A
MSKLQRDVLDCIGNTSLLALRNIVPKNGSRTLLKLESENPTGSLKDRMALAMIEAAEADLRLTAGGSVVEYTGGSTGVSLSLICAVKGYPLHIVTSDAFAREKLDHMKVLGARLQIVPSDGGRMTGKLTRDLVEAARVIAAKTGGFWTDQLNKKDQLAAYHKMAEEIWIQTDGRIDGFVQTMGTAASLQVSGRLYAVTSDRSELLLWSRRNPRFSRVASQVPIRSMGSEQVLWYRPGRRTSPIRLNGFRRARLWPWPFGWPGKKAFFAGTSTGANVIAALRLAEQLGPRATIVSVMCDTGMKYLRTYGTELSKEGVAVDDAGAR